MLSSSLSTIFQVINNQSNSTIDKDFNLCQKSLDFRIITKQSSYCLIGLYSHIINHLFIVERSYEDQSQIVSNTDQYLQTKTLLFLHSICIFIYDQIIIQPFYNIILHMIYPSSSDKTFITIKRSVIEIFILRITFIHSIIRQ